MMRIKGQLMPQRKEEASSLMVQKKDSLGNQGNIYTFQHTAPSSCDLHKFLLKYNLHKKIPGKRGNDE